MAYGFLTLATTTDVLAAHGLTDAGRPWRDFNGDRAFDRSTENEAASIAASDSFYKATASQIGSPSDQHRGGAVDFLRLIADPTLAFADLSGNRQYTSLGNPLVDECQLRLVALGGSCSQRIVLRFTEGEIAKALRPLRKRPVAFEAENSALRAGTASPPTSDYEARRT